ncbi:MAG: GapR family DNA-binding domain-containing protein, partial [Xanthobacteraceae bacterium]
MANAAVTDDTPAHRFAKDQLKAFVERVERLEEEKKAIADDIRDV